MKPFETMLIRSGSFSEYPQHNLAFYWKRRKKNGDLGPDYHCIQGTVKPA